MYMVRVTYVSITPKLGMQFFIGDAKAKGYLPQSGGMDVEHTTNLSQIYLSDTKPGLVGILTGDDSNGPGFKLRKVTLEPCPEGHPIAQGIDGLIRLNAKDATTFSKKMRYEPKKEKDCLGFWTEVDDWAEWNFAVHDGGKFQLEVFQGCGGGNHGSEVSVWINQKEYNFKVADTGGFQSWQAQNLGTVEIDDGRHIVTIKPKTKTGKAVMDIQKIVLRPLAAE